MSAGTVSSFDTLVSSALALPPEQRVELAERLWLSVEGTLEDEALFAEIDRREAEIESGEVRPIPFDQAMSDIRNQISK
jgi:putative addiction module component (TIGR02574 family)